MMNAELMVKPSSLMSSGIELSQFGDVYLFRFNDSLQARLEELLEKVKLEFSHLAKSQSGLEFLSYLVSLR